MVKTFLIKFEIYQKRHDKGNGNASWGEVSCATRIKEKNINEKYIFLNKKCEKVIMKSRLQLFAVVMNMSLYSSNMRNN